MALASAHFLAVASLAERQFDTLSAEPVDAGPDEGLEESMVSVDLGATLARIQRHANAASGAPSREAAYEEYVTACVDALGLANISGAEYVALFKRVTSSGVRATLPPPWVLARQLVLLVGRQSVRDLAGLPYRFNSAFRADPYNRAIGGARWSQHVVGTAFDGKLVGGSVRDLHAIEARLEGVRISLTTRQRAVIARVAHDYQLSGVLKSAAGREPFSARGLGYDGGGFRMTGGVGTYSTFVHRDHRGIRARWNG